MLTNKKRIKHGPVFNKLRNIAADVGISFDSLMSGRIKLTVGTGGPFKLKVKKVIGYRNARINNPTFKFRKVKQYGDWVEMGTGFDALHEAVGYLSRVRHEKNKYAVFKNGKIVYSI